MEFRDAVGWSGLSFDFDCSSSASALRALSAMRASAGESIAIRARIAVKNGSRSSQRELRSSISIFAATQHVAMIRELGQPFRRILIVTLLDWLERNLAHSMLEK